MPWIGSRMSQKPKDKISDISEKSLRGALYKEICGRVDEAVDRCWPENSGGYDNEDNHGTGVTGGERPKNEP